MTVSYLDTSAAMKLLLEEPESAALVEALASDPHCRLAASWLLHTELHCAAGRHPDDVAPDAVRGVLNAVTLVDLSRGDMIAAGAHAPLRSNDAIHLAVAIRLGVDEIITYDRELAEVASRAGLTVVAPA
ncbi:MAG: type II toxin-antitoxin system VapC family toxin [Microbacterium sp.]|uniref:type II toxin-antitoxin system VapC family toxin n=1 Tax=Microbacterium sp. TaxID=51671 RepID=UPI0039E4FF2B